MYCCTADYMYCCTAQVVLQTLCCLLLLMYRLLQLLQLPHRTAPVGWVPPGLLVLQQDSNQRLLHQVRAAPLGVVRIQTQSVQGQRHCHTVQPQLLLLQPQMLVYLCCCWHSSQSQLQWQQLQQLQRCWNLLLLGSAAALHRFQTATTAAILAAAAAWLLPAAACS
jgi:hypothetical protein